LAEHIQPSRRAAGHRRLDDATEDFFDRFDAYLDIERHLSLQTRVGYLKSTRA